MATGAPDAASRNSLRHAASGSRLSTSRRLYAMEEHSKSSKAKKITGPMKRALARGSTSDLLFDQDAPARTVSKGRMQRASELAKATLRPLRRMNKGAFYLITDWPVEERYVNSLRNGTLTWRGRLHRFLGSPASTRSSRCFALLSGILAVASIVLLGIEMSAEAAEVRNHSGEFSCGLNATASWKENFDAYSFSEWSDRTYQCFTYYLITWFFLVVFGIELLLRIISYPRPWASYVIWLDLFSILPLVVRVIIFSLGMRPLDLDAPVRIFVEMLSSLAALRLLKVTRHVLGTVILDRVLFESLTALMIPGYMLVCSFTFFGSVIWAVEFDPSDLSNANRVPDITSAWWMLIVTMTTVGYGDYSPQTSAGKIITAIAIFVGLCFTAMPLSIVGNHFSAAWEYRTMDLIKEQLKRGLVRHGYSPKEVAKGFEAFDSDKDGSVTYIEFKNVLTQKLKVDLQVKDLHKVWKNFDPNDEGVVFYSEFCAAMFPEYEVDLGEEEEPPDDSMQEDSFSTGSIGSDARRPSIPSHRSPSLRSSAGGSSESTRRYIQDAVQVENSMRCKRHSIMKIAAQQSIPRSSLSSRGAHDGARTSGAGRLVSLFRSGSSSNNLAAAAAAQGGGDGSVELSSVHMGSIPRPRRSGRTFSISSVSEGSISEDGDMEAQCVGEGGAEAEADARARAADGLAAARAASVAAAAGSSVGVSGEGGRRARWEEGIESGLAKVAAQQEELRSVLERLLERLPPAGGGSS